MRDSAVSIVVVVSLLAGKIGMAQNYAIVGTGQTKCYDNRAEIAPPKPGQPFYGQDAQHPGRLPVYQLSADGLTVYDNITAMTWQHSPGLDKLTAKQAEALPAKLNAEKFAGFSDWRLPSIKELYSLILFSGVDAAPEEAGHRTPFIDTKFFKFAYGDTSAGERIIDSQWATSTRYIANYNQMFGVNFADGRIKGYGTTMPGRGEKKFFAICCRGNPQYGKNDFYDNGDDTITDRATGLVWQKNDSGKGLNWEQALAYAANLKGGWRLPNAKELQSIVDYTRCPDTTGSPAINPLLSCTPIKNEIGQTDYPFYWTCTTHAGLIGGNAAVYVAFGRAAGWPTGMPGQGGGLGRSGPLLRSPGMDGPPDFNRPGSGSVSYHYADVHGAGAQRSDPKAGNPADFPHGRGPQGDVIRVYNFVRLVRGGLTN